MVRKLARLTRKNRHNRYTLKKTNKLNNKSGHAHEFTSKMRHRTRRGGYDITSKKEAKTYLSKYKTDAPYLEKDEELEVYDPTLDIDEDESPAYVLGNKPPPPPNWLTGKVDTSDLTGREKRSWNPFSKFTRKNKMQRVPTTRPVMKPVENISETESETYSDDYDDDDSKLTDIYDEVRAETVTTQEPETKPGLFSRLFGKKQTQGQGQGQGQGLGQGNDLTQKKPWYKFWGGLAPKRTRKIRKIRKTRQLKRRGKKMHISKRI